MRMVAAEEGRQNATAPRQSPEPALSEGHPAKSNLEGSLGTQTKMVIMGVCPRTPPQNGRQQAEKAEEKTPNNTGVHAGWQVKLHTAACLHKAGGMHTLHTHTQAWWGHAWWHGQAPPSATSVPWGKGRHRIKSRRTSAITNGSTNLSPSK